MWFGERFGRSRGERHAPSARCWLTGEQSWPGACCLSPSLSSCLISSPALTVFISPPFFCLFKSYAPFSPLCCTTFVLQLFFSPPLISPPHSPHVLEEVNKLSPSSSSSFPSPPLPPPPRVTAALLSLSPTSSV